jgi:hypothetical protein
VVIIETIFAAAVLALCVALLLRMALPERRRLRIDARLRRMWWSLRDAALRLRSRRGDARSAAREAEDAIRRAQHKARRDGKVSRPDAFKRPRKPH